MTGGRDHKTIELQDRDRALLLGLFESRLMTLAHASALYFGGKSEAAKKRVQKLKAAGFLAERPRRPYQPSILSLTRRAFELLGAQGALSGFPSLGWRPLSRRLHVSPLTLAHELDVMSVKATLTPAINALASHRVAEFSTWPRLFEFHARRITPEGGGREVLVRPDAFIRIDCCDQDVQRQHTFFLELDRSSEPQETLAVRAACYLDYYRSGGLAQRYGSPPEAYKHHPFRVLMVFRNPERRNNTAERLLLTYPPIRNQVWLTTLKEVTTDPLGPIWIKPGDYLKVTEGTIFDGEHRRHWATYRRQAEREHFIETNVPKHPLLTPLAEGSNSSSDIPQVIVQTRRSGSR